MTPGTVGPSGPLTSRIYIVGEAPGQTEVIRGLPFVGPAGNVLWSNLLNRGIRREQCRVNNVIHHMLKGNSWLNATPQEIEEGAKDLRIDILACKPSLILALGGGVLQVLSGKRGIDNWRGSVLLFEDGATGFRCNLLPTYHPARLFHKPKDSPLFYFDLGKVRKLADGSIFEPTPTHVAIRPTSTDVQAYTQFLREQPRIAFDIETFPDLDNRLARAKCIAFAHSSTEGMCIPMTKEYWGNNYDLVMGCIKEVLENEVPKEGQNGQYDIAVLRAAHGIQVRNYDFDTMCAQHIAYPELPKSLATLCSIYTNRPYYKFMRGATDDSVLWEYNAIDALVTFEAATNLRLELEEHGTLEFYRTVVHPLIDLMIELQERGVRVDLVQMHKLKMMERLKFAASRTELWERVGWPCNPFSPKHLQHLLYEQLGLPKVVKDGKVSTDKIALRKLKAKVNNPIFDLVLECRRALKQDSTYLSFANIRNGRMHTSYNIGGKVTDQDDGRTKSAPETGRLSSSTSIVYFSGANLQNQTRGLLRSIYLPETDEVLLEADLSQAEARVVAYEANDPLMIRVFEEGLDIHMINSELIAKAAPEVLERYGGSMKELRNNFAKQHVHAFNYLEGPYMFSERAGVSRVVGERIRGAYYERYSGLRAWHQKVETALRSGLAEWKVPVRTLRNLLGRIRLFFGRLDEGTLREAVAFVPQSTIGDLLNIQFLECWRECKQRGLVAKPLLQVHDSQVWSCPRAELSTLAGLIKAKADIELTTSDGLRKFKVPVELKVGENWGEMKEYKDV